jgi:hypothetical protein
MTTASESRQSPLLVLLAGLLTTALTLAGVWWLGRNSSDFNIMGWYANYVIPAGALLVGAAAGSGYGLASWWTGLKIRRSLLAVVLGLQLVAYAAAEYIDYRDLVQAADVGEGAPGFLAYFHLKTMSFAWQHHGRPGNPIGMWGYLFVGLAVVGFGAGGVVAPALLARVAYCERCQMYMRSRQLTTLPASVKHRRVSKKDADAWTAYQEEQRLAAERGGARLQELADLTRSHDGYALKAAVARDNQGAKAAAKLPARIAVHLVHCRQCLDAHLQPVALSGHGNQQKATKLERIAAGPEIAKALRDGA